MVMIQTEVYAVAADTLAGSPASMPAAPVAEMSLWQLCLEGGWIMIPLALLLILSIYVFIERALVIGKAAKVDAYFMEHIRDYIHDGEIESALKLCKRTPTPYARLISKGISRIGRPTADVLVAVENTGTLELAALGKGLPWLATTAAGAPMLGFLGTVVGMVQAFYAIANSGNAASIGSFAGGIYTALTTTVAGLIVGIVAMFGYNFLVARINKVTNLMEAKTMEFMDLLNEPAN